MQKLRKIGVVLLIIYISMLLLLYFLQEKLIFLPTTLEQDFDYSFSVPHKEINITSDDGAVLNAVHFKNDLSKGLILYFHGNAGNIARWGEIATFFVEKQYDVLLMDYRTYGKSTGKLSEEALYEDAQLFYEYALKEYTADNITLYGRSLGTGIATKLASWNKPKMLILETPYNSLVEVAQNKFPIVPVHLLMKYQFNSNSYMKDVTCPVYIFHGTADAVVPYASGKRLFQAIPHTEKEFISVEGAGHNNLILYSEYLEGIDDILK